MHRKLHRQKKLYTVYGGFFVDSTGARIRFNTAMPNWTNKAAVNRGFRQWRKMIATSLSDAEATGTGKWNDFKVYLDNQHGTPINPKDASDNEIWTGGVGEWDYSTLTSGEGQAPGAAKDAFELMIVGPHTGSNLGTADAQFTRVGLVESWFNSRPAPHSPSPLDIPDIHDPIMNLFDTGDDLDERMAVISAEGDQPPYDEDSSFGNAQAAGNSNNLQRVSVAQPTGSNQPIAPIHGFQALCGLIQIHVGDDTGSNTWELVLDVESEGERF